LSFKNAFIRFSPRYLVENFSGDKSIKNDMNVKNAQEYAAKVAEIEAAHGIDCRINVKAEVVDVANPAGACEVAQCIKAFESRKVKALEKGMRAIRVASCANPESRPMYLLWGSSSVLVLQPDRTSAGLWQQASSKSSKQLKMETEAAYGILSFERGRFRWLERAE
jgi:hypothetical protein